MKNRGSSPELNAQLWKRILTRSVDHQKFIRKIPIVIAGLTRNLLTVYMDTPVRDKNALKRQRAHSPGKANNSLSPGGDISTITGGHEVYPRTQVPKYYAP